MEKGKTGLQKTFKFVDLFCGIGGFHIAAVQNGGQCVFASDIDDAARAAYKANFDFDPHGDITEINEYEIPDHDLLCAGFPCQPFSIIGKRLGFDDKRGSLFFDILRIMKAKKPQYAVLENVKQIVSHNKGKTLSFIINQLKEIGYKVSWKILNALDYGLPQKRERIIIVCVLGNLDFSFPVKETACKHLSEILEKNVEKKYCVSARIREKRKSFHKSRFALSIWHENKSGNVTSHPFSCALRAGASHNYLLINGERRLTPREMLRLQGFPDAFKIVCSDSQARKQIGNAVPVPIIARVIEHMR